MNILAIDTSSRACVLGVRTEAGTFSDETVLDRSHSQEVLPRIDALLQQAGVSKSSLEMIAYGQGPGSFTGLRIGIGVVQGLAFGLDIPVVGVSTLACLAQRQLRLDEHRYALVALDARLTEVYFGAYQEVDGLMQLVEEEGVREADQMSVPDAQQSWVGVGSGWKHRALIEAACGIEVLKVFESDYPQAIDLLDLGQSQFEATGGQPAALALPEYLREQVATKST